MFVLFGSFFVFARVCSSANVPHDPSRSLVLIFATSPADPYYGKYFNDITQFQVNLAKAINDAGDNVLVFAYPKVAAAFLKELSPDMVLQEGQGDIWARDFSTVRMNKPTRFVYGPDYIKATTAKAIQQQYYETINYYCPNHGITPSKVVLDGGNVVDNFVDTAFITRRVVKDNGHTDENHLKEELKSALNYTDIVFVPDGGDTTGHSDGMVSFIDTHTLAITGSLQDQPKLYQETIADIKNQAPELAEHLLILNSTWAAQVWQGFDSACGLHINSLLTAKNLFVPTFGGDSANKEYDQSDKLDQLVLNQIKDHTTRNVTGVPVPNKICRMGGSVRCLTSAIQGPLADCLLSAASTWQ